MKNILMVMFLVCFSSAGFAETICGTLKSEKNCGIGGCSDPKIITEEGPIRIISVALADKLQQIRDCHGSFKGCVTHNGEWQQGFEGSYLKVTEIKFTSECQ